MTISVVIPSHNRLDELKIAIKSVFGQTMVPNELIVVDDGSSQPLDENIFKGAPKKIQCILLTNKTPKGGNFARNIAVKEAKSEYIAFLDDDDEFFNQKLEEVTKSIKENPDTDLFYHIAKIQMVNERLFYYSKPSYFEDKKDFFKNLLIGNFIGGTPMVIVKKQSLIEVGSFDEEMPALQDYELWLRMAKAEMAFKFINKALTKYNYVTERRTVSKSFKINETARDLIRNKFNGDYNKLNKSELVKHEEYVRNNIIHRAILNNQRKVALKLQYKQMTSNFNLTNFFKFISILLGSKFIFFLKTKGF